MNISWKLVVVTVLSLTLMGNQGCERRESSDEVQRQQQERILREGTAQTGMPNIKNFRERKLMKDILELRDQEGVVTYTYTYSEMTGKPVFLCNSIGYALPYSTQYTNPVKVVTPYTGTAVTIDQADPNGLFSPSSAEASWVICNNPDPKHPKKTGLVYSEPKLIVSPFPLQTE